MHDAITTLQLRLQRAQARAPSPTRPFPRDYPTLHGLPKQPGVAHLTPPTTSSRRCLSRHPPQPQLAILYNNRGSAKRRRATSNAPRRLRQGCRLAPGVFHGYYPGGRRRRGAKLTRARGLRPGPRPRPFLTGLRTPMLVRRNKGYTARPYRLRQAVRLAPETPSALNHASRHPSLRRPGAALANSSAHPVKPIKCPTPTRSARFLRAANVDTAARSQTHPRRPASTPPTPSARDRCPCPGRAT